MKDDYVPSKKILKKYADVLVNFALNSGDGMKKEEVVYIAVPDVAKELGREIRNEVLRQGGFPLFRLYPTEFDKEYFELANEKQLTFFPEKYLEEKSKLIDHTIGIIADVDPFELKGTDPKKIIKSRDAAKPYRDWLVEKEVKGKYTWTAGLWATQAKAKEVGLSYKEYWKQIINACFLDKPDPIGEWKKVTKLQKDILNKLSKMKIDYLKVKGEDVDLKVGLGETRKWNGGSGRNIPSFEIFTSPDWREVEGTVRFDQPVYRYGQVIEDISLEIKDGIVVKAKAKKGNKFLQEMLKSKNADKIGEFSLTDKRMSRITHFMAETLFDENVGGPFGNMHLAVGMSYKDTYNGTNGHATEVTPEEWEEMGFNDAAEHTDIVSTTDRTVTAVLKGGQEKVIYENGEFTLA